MEPGVMPTGDCAMEPDIVVGVPAENVEVDDAVEWRPGGGISRRMAAGFAADCSGIAAPSVTLAQQGEVEEDTAEFNLPLLSP